MSVFLTSTSAFAEKRNQKIVVIGAGLAGLTTAYRLQQAGMNVDLYEARNRVGGRVFTVNIDGHIGELGAQNITDGGEAINFRRLIEEFGLELTESRVNLDHAYFNGTDLIPIQQILRKKHFDPQTLSDQLKALASKFHNMKEILSGIIEENDPLYQVMAVRLAAYEGAPIEKLSTFYTDTLFHMLQGGISSAHQGSGQEENYVDLISVKGGNALLPKKIAERLGTRLHLNMPVKKIEKSDDQSFTLTFDQDLKVNADILILAIPCSVYENIIFEDTVMASDRLEAIKSVQYGTNAKILIPFSTIPSKRIGLINDQTVCFFDATRNLLTLYYTGETSRFSSDTILNRYTQTRAMIEMGFETHSPPFVSPRFAEDKAFAAYDGPVGYSWPNDPYVKGSYSYISPGQEELLTAISEENGEKFKTLFAPIQQRLYFAGEHTSILMDVLGTMEAACESGERMARAIISTY